MADAGHRCRFGLTVGAWPGVVGIGIRSRICGAGHGGTFRVDTCGESVDPRGQRVDLIEDHPGQFGVVVVELAGQCLDQVGVLEFEPAAGQAGQDPRAAAATGSVAGG